MADKPDKSNRLKARLPRGLADRGPGEIAATRRMIEAIREVYELYGFEPVETPTIEYTDALGKFLPDQDRPNEGVFSFQDDDEQWLSLRYDLTAPLARYVAERIGTADFTLPYRSYRYGYVFRNEKPGPGRFRQFMQFDADTVGAKSMAADAEICMMAADTMEALGIKRGDYVVKVWSRKLLDGVMDAVPELQGAPPEMRLTVLRSIDKLDRVGLKGIQQLLDEGRKDDSGDFTKGAGLSKSANNFITASSSSIYVGELSDHSLISFDQAFESQVSTFEAGTKRQFDFDEYRHFANQYLGGRPAPTSLEEGLAELEEISRLVSASGYDGRVRIDPSVVRGLEYYTGPVYEVELTFEVKDDNGRPVRFGSVGGGGRYDGLVARFRGEPVPATGFSIGVSRLQAALAALGKSDGAAEQGPVVVTVFDRDRIADYQRMVQRLRAENIRAELYLGNGKFGPQMKYADKRNAPCVVIQGSDEKNDPAGAQVVVKDLMLGAELAKLEKGREEHLAKQAEAQRKVSEDKLVETVREILARQAGNRP